jgi:hypothetical protein
MNVDAHFSSRRGTPRIAVDGHLYGSVVGLNIAVHVVDIGFGGVSFQSSIPFRVGVTHVLRLTTEDGLAVQLRSRVAHCRRVPTGASGAGFLVGCEFLPTPNTERAVMRLIDAVMGVLVFETA